MKVQILFLSICFPFLLQGQNNYMSLSFGGILPVGEFGSTIDLLKNGFAGTGFSGDYSGALFLNKHLGVGGNIKYASNPVLDQVAAELLRNETPLFLKDTSIFRVSTGMWNQIAITIGPEITFALEKLNIDLFALGGLNFILPPDLSVRVETNDESYYREFETNSVSYGVDLGVAVRYHLSDVTSLRIHCSLFGSTSNGEITKSRIADNIVTTETENYNCAITTINLGIGIVYRL